MRGHCKKPRLKTRAIKPRDVLAAVVWVPIAAALWVGHKFGRMFKWDG